MPRSFAVDYGASNLRVIAVDLSDRGLTARELLRAPNAIVATQDGYFWDHARLFGCVEAGLARAADGAPTLGIGADSWGVDVVLLGADGRPVARPRAYRDPRFDGWMQRWWTERSGARAVYAATGIQGLSINTLYQLYTMAHLERDALRATRHLLFTADYVHYLLAGCAVNERTLASTSQMLTPDGEWWGGATAALDLPAGALGEIVAPGTDLGGLRAGTAPALAGARVVAPAAHDTQSAILAVPATGTGDWAYVSCGTWSIIGAESPVPVTNPEAFAAGLGNETGHGGTYCVQSTVTGLWLIQEIARILGDGSDGASLGREAADEPAFRSIVDPAHPRFLAPTNMISEIRAACRDAGEPVPGSRAAITRCAYDSLALLYRATLADLAQVTGRRFERLHMVGGGANAKLLNTITAAATGMPVLAGPVEATAIGNALAQFIALGQIACRAEGRALIARSFPPILHEPQLMDGLDAAIARFDTLRQGRLNERTSR